jgi:acyl carrier protein
MTRQVRVELGSHQEEKGAEDGQDVVRAVRAFILDRLAWGGPPAHLTESLPLLEQGVLDSLGVYRLISFLERSFGIEVRDEDLIPENFLTLAAIAGFVERRVGTGGDALDGGRRA